MALYCVFPGSDDPQHPGFSLSLFCGWVWSWEEGRRCPRVTGSYRPSGWDTDWPYWFARQGQPSPDLSRASDFRLYSMVVEAAVEGMGTAIGHSRVMARDMERGDLVPLFDRQVEAPVRSCLITTAGSRRNPGVQAFREWILIEA